MRPLTTHSATVATLLLVIVTATTSEGHRHHGGHVQGSCIHGDAAIQRLVIDGMDHVAPQPAEDVRAVGAQAVGPVRIKFFGEDLSIAGRFCSSVGEVVPDFKGGTQTCTSNDILTEERKTILLEKILPAAAERLQSHLSLAQATNNIVVPSTSTCSPFTIPSSHTTTGVADADYVIYVSSVPSTAGNLAWAGYCALTTTGRPVIGRANFATKYISWSDTDASVGEDQILTAVHEFTHALGFTPTMFKSTKTVTLRGKTATLITSSAVVAKVREYFACDTLEGGELEDEGGSGSRGAHWDRRVLKDEMMAAAGGALFSTMTLAHLQDTGFYTVDYGSADDMTWAKGAGCGFNTEPCNTAEGGKDKYFCFATKDQCVDGYDSVGYCPILTYTSALPSYFQYFSDPTKGGYEFFDGCPVPTAYSNRHCGEPKTDTSDLSAFGFYFGSGGKCLDTTGLLKSGLTAPGSTTLRCLQARCQLNPLRIEYQVASTGWRQCPTDGSLGSSPAPSGWQNAIICPAAVDFCDNDITVGVTTAVPTPKPTAVTTAEPPAGPTAEPPAGPTAEPTAGATAAPTAKPTAGGTVAPPTPIPTATPIPPDVTEAAIKTGDVTIEGKVTLSGAKSTWDSILSTDNGAASVRNAFRSDFAALFQISRSRVKINSLKTGSLVVTYGMVDVTSVTSEDVKDALDTRQGTSSWLTEIQSVYRTADATATITLTSGSATAVDNGSVCGSSIKSDQCTAIIAGAAAGGAVLLLLSLIIYCCCCRRKSADPKEAGRMVPARPAPRRQEPYHR